MEVFSGGTIIDQLKEIKKMKQNGHIKKISEDTGLNRGLISNYIINGHRMIIKRIYAEKIIKSFLKTCIIA